MTHERDTEPWYRQFWPWFLILLPATAVVASLYTVSLAVRTTDSLVTSTDDGIDVETERLLAAERSAARLGLGAELAVDSTTGAIRATLTAASRFERPKTLELTFSHPTLAARDLTVTLTAALPDGDGNPTWAGHVTGIPPGRRYLVLRAGDSWRLTGTWAGETVVRLPQR